MSLNTVTAENRSKLGRLDNYLPVYSGDVNPIINKINNPSYKVYTALLTQSGTDAPTAVVLENTIGNIVWSYNSVGDYIGTLTGAFTPNKTAGFLGSDFTSILGSGKLSNYNGDIDTIDVQTWDITNNPSDDILLSTFIEIRVYN